MSTQLCWITRERFMCTWREHKLHNAVIHTLTHTRTHTYRMRACWAVGVARSLAIVKIAAIIHVLPATEITTTTTQAEPEQSISVVIQLKQMLKMQITQWFTFRLTYFRRTVCSIQSSTHPSSICPAPFSLRSVSPCTLRQAPPFTCCPMPQHWP